jgi:hypothetical protein
MKTIGASEEVVREGCRALSALAFDRWSQWLLRRSRSWESVLEALSPHEFSPETQSAGLECLARIMLGTSTPMSRPVAAKAVCEVIGPAMKANVSDAGVQRWGRIVLLMLSRGSVASKGHSMQLNVAGLMQWLKAEAPPTLRETTACAALAALLLSRVEHMGDPSSRPRGKLRHKK